MCSQTAPSVASACRCRLKISGVLSCVVLCRAVLDCAVLCRTVLNGAALCCAGVVQTHTHTHTSTFSFLFLLLAALSEITESMFITETINRKCEKKRTKTQSETIFGLTQRNACINKSSCCRDEFLLSGPVGVISDPESLQLTLIFII